MRAARLRGTEFAGMTGRALLVLGLFLPWSATDASNSRSEVGGRTGALSGWVVHPIPRWLLLAGFVATIVMVAAAATRSSESERPRKPPGTV